MSTFPDGSSSPERIISILNSDLWGANSYSSHKSERFPSLVIFDALVRWCQTKANGSPKTAGHPTT